MTTETTNATVPMTAKEKFEALRAKMKTSSQVNGGGQKRSDDPNLIKLEAGKSYKFRLLFNTDEANGRDIPFIKNFTHVIKVGERYERCTCKRVDGVMGQCEVCQNIRPWYNSTDVIENMLNKVYRAKFGAFAAVYMIIDPTTPTNQGHVKILPIIKDCYGPLLDQIFGKEKTESAPGETEMVLEEPLNFAAFDLENGHDLIVTVTKKGDFNNYSFKFTRTASNLGVNEEDIKREFEALNFNRYADKFNAATATNFVEKFVKTVPESIIKFVSEKLTKEAAKKGLPPPAPRTVTAPLAPAAPKVDVPSVPAPQAEVPKTQASRVETAKASIESNISELAAAAEESMSEEAGLDADIDAFLKDAAP